MLKVGAFAAILTANEAVVLFQDAHEFLGTEFHIVRRPLHAFVHLLLGITRIESTGNAERRT